MFGIYYKTPIDFKSLVQKKELEKTNLEHSIAQFINTIATTSFGECKFDSNFGCNIWDADFDLLTNTNMLKQDIKEGLISAIKLNEKRLDLKDIEVDISEEQVSSVDKALRMKKKVSITINGFVKKTNRSFQFYGYFYLGPLSYL